MQGARSLSKIGRSMRVLLSLCCFLALSTAFAEQLSASVTGARGIIAGMSYQEVVRVLGLPQERVEREALHEDLWIYPRVAIVFKEGKVSGSQDPVSRQTVPFKVQEVRPSPSPSQNNESVAIEEILSDIMSISGGDDSASSNDSSNVSTLPRNIMPPPPPPMLGGQEP